MSDFKSLAPRARFIFTEETWFIITIALVMGAASLPTWSHEFLLAVAVCVLIILYLEFRRRQAEKKVNQFRLEVESVNKFEDQYNFDKARQMYFDLILKYQTMPRFVQVLQDCLAHMDSRGSLTLKKSVVAAPSPAPSTATAPEKRGVEKRRHKRVAVEFRVAAVASHGGAAKSGDATVRDMSLSGVLIYSRMKLESGDAVVLSKFVLPDGSSLDEVAGKVMRVAQDEMNTVAGVQFDSLNEAEKKKIVSYLRKALDHPAAP